MFLGSISPWYVVLDSAKNAYMVGDTGPTSFPTTAGAFQMTAANSAFATNLKATGTALIYSTCLGSNASTSETYGAALDANNALYVGGDTTGGGLEDAFIAKISPMDALTATATITNSPTPTETLIYAATASSTATQTQTATSMATFTGTPTASASPTLAASASLTSNLPPTGIPTLTLFSTVTARITATNTASYTALAWAPQPLCHPQL